MPKRALVGAGKYVMGSHLGFGAFSEVFKAIDLETKRSVAVKKLNHEEEAIIMQTKDEIMLEAHIVGKLNHPNIIKFLDAYVLDDRHHLVFESMETELDGIINDPHIILSPADIKSYMQMFLQGLAYLHHNSILHRDLKADNVLIGTDGQLKLADFGCARFYKPKEEEFINSKVSDPMAELQREQGPEADIWAAASIFEELILKSEDLLLEASEDLHGASAANESVRTTGTHDHSPASITAQVFYKRPVADTSSLASTESPSTSILQVPAPPLHATNSNEGFGPPQK